MTKQEKDAIKFIKNFFCKEDKDELFFEDKQAKTLKKIRETYNNISTSKQQKLTVYFPVNLATEVQYFSKRVSPKIPLLDNEIPSSLLTVQMRPLCSMSSEDTLVYSITPKSGAKQINPEVDFIPLQFFQEELGFGIKKLIGREWYKFKKKNYPTINLVIYCFDGKTSIFNLFRRYSSEDAKSKQSLGCIGLMEILKQAKEGFINELGSYLHAGKKPWINQSIELPYLLIAPISSSPSKNSQNKQKFKVSIQFIDIASIHGNNKEFSEITSNVELDYNPKIKSEEEDNLQDIYEQDWQRFLDHAKSKCIYYDILRAYEKKMRKIYDDLSVPDFKAPKLTIGATVKRLLESAVINKVLKRISSEQDAEGKLAIKKLLKDSSISSLEIIIKDEITKEFVGKHDKEDNKRKSQRLNEKLLLTKIVGGRTYCGKPLYLCEPDARELICDSDIRQAYPTVLKNRDIPLGHCQIVQDISLKDYIKKHRGNAEENLELVYVTVEGEELPESQNFLHSLTFKKSKFSKNSDGTEETQNNIYTHQIIQSPFTTSTFLWLEYLATPKLRKYIEENGKVLIGAYYQKDKFVSLEESAELIDSLIQEEKWTKVPLGETIVNDLLNKRSQYRKKDNGGTDAEQAMNNLFKLMSNTIYGALSSPNFNICNPIVANNVTSDVRLMVWCMETALGGFQTITDGVSWCLNKVLVGKNTRYKVRPLDSRHHLLHRLNYQKAEDRRRDGWDGSVIGDEVKHYKWDEAEQQILQKPARTNTSNTKGDEWDEIEPQDLLKLIDQFLIPEHLKRCFPPEFVDRFINRLGFEIESKGLYTSITIDGRANYVLTLPASSSDNEPVIKRRSHKTKQGVGREIFKKYYQDLHENPECVPIPMPYIDYEVVSCGDYKQRYQSHYQYSLLIPGDYEPKVKTFQAFQFYQFTFRTHEQYEKFRKEHEKARKKYGLSAERYHWCFTEDGKIDYRHINYKQMLEEFDSALCPQPKQYTAYRNYQNGKNRTRLRKYPSLEPPQNQNPKNIKGDLVDEHRRLFDYQVSDIQEVPLSRQETLSETVLDNTQKSTSGVS